MQVQRPCPLCTGDRAERLAQLAFGDFDGAALDHTVTVVACDRCGFVYNDSGTGQAALDTFYESHSLYAAEMGVGSGGLSPWDRKRYADTLAMLERYLESREAAIIDVGCAKGGFLQTLKQQGYRNLYGVDLSPACVAMVQERHGIEAAVGSTGQLPFGELAPDVLVYSHVFEHLHDLVGAVEEAHRRLRDDGLVLIEFPDASLYARYPVSDYYWLGQREHVNHLDAAQLDALMVRCGFERIAVEQPIMRIAANTENPLVRAIYRKGTRSRPRGGFAMRDAMRGYLDSQRASMDQRRRVVEGLAASGRPCYVWGIGLEFFCLYTLADLRSLTIRCLIDNNPSKQERTVDGLRIVAQDRLADATADETVLLTSALHKNTLARELETMGFKGEVIRLA